MASGGDPDHPTEQQQQQQQQQGEANRMLLDYKHKLELADEQNIKLYHENRDLKLRLDRAMVANSEMDNVVKRLQQELQSARDHSRMLEHQVRVCTGEMESARADRNMTRSKIEELEQELRIVHRQLDQFQGRQMEEIAARRQAALQNYRDEYERAHPGYQNPVNFVGRGGLIAADGFNDADLEDEDGDGCDTVDFGGFNGVHFNGVHSTAVTAQPQCSDNVNQSGGELECPNCLKGFSLAEHEKMLEHIEECI